jgi:hypothetical protein
VTGPGAGTKPGFLAEPDIVLIELARQVEPTLDPILIQEAIDQAAPTRAQRRRLAHALRNDPGLLTSARPQGPPQIERLIRALCSRGATRCVVPLCAHCQQPKPLTQRDGEDRICGWCDLRRRSRAEPCAGCGEANYLASRDRHGRPLCRRCVPYGVEEQDPVEQLSALVHAADPELDGRRVIEAIRAAIPRRFQRHQVLWELQARPGLLTGEGAHGSPRLNALVQALVAAGATRIIAPACPSCGRVVALRFQQRGLRCCRRCYDHARHAPCSRCRQRRPVASRTPSGDPVCASCFNTDAANHERCLDCGITTYVIRHNGQPRCRRCFRAPSAICTICRHTRPCHFARTDRARCENCSRRMTQHPCARCGRTRPVSTRDSDGQPLCESCGRRREPCASCGRTRKVASRVEQRPLCRTCYRKHPASFRECSHCGTVERLHHHGLCTRCACHQKLLALLSRDGDLAPASEPIFHLLAASDPTAVLSWLEHSSAARVLIESSQHNRPMTHAVLDAYPPTKAIEHLRKVLITGGVLPARDNHLARFERWIDAALAKIDDPGERRVVHRFARWHQLRRLRSKAEHGPLTAAQADRAQAELREAIHLLRWLRQHNTTLSEGTQHHIDDWLAQGRSTCHNARPFLAWAVRNKHAHQVEIPIWPGSGPAARIEDDHRWALVRALLHDEHIALEERVAGLLLLLYAQPLAKISRITRDQVRSQAGDTQLVLGTHPLRVPPPLNQLLQRLAGNRRGHAAFGHTDQHPWLFPGGAPGQPLSTAHLTRRLATHGIHVRASRNSALFDLAGHLPAVVLSKLLGISINTATNWNHRAGTTHAAYAAAVARREELSKI